MTNFKRVKSDSMNTTNPQYTILRYIAESPGTHFSRIVRELGLSHGTVTYHTRKLEKNELITHRRVGCRKCFFLSKYDDEPINLTPHQKRVQSIIENNPRISNIEIASIMGVTRQAVNYHTKNLSHLGSISSIKGSRKRIWIVTDRSLL